MADLTTFEKLSNLWNVSATISLILPNRYICIMEAKEFIPDLLNEQQLLMLRLFKNPMPEESFLQIRRLAVKLLSEQLDQTIEKWENENGITAEYYDNLANEHFRSASRQPL